MSFGGTMAVVLRQFYLMRGSAARVLPLFAWVAIDIVLWGFMAKYLSSITSSGFRFVPSLLGAVLLWDFFGRVIFGVTTAFLEDVWSRNFLNFFASPMTIPDYVGGLVLSSILTSCIGLFAMVLLAAAAFGLSLFSYGIALLPFLLVLFLFGIAMGIFGTAIVLRFGPAAEWFIWPLPALISPFASVFYPLSTLPQWMQWTARLLPPSYVFESVRATVQGQNPWWAGLGVSAVLALLYIVLAGMTFTRVFRLAIRTGLIARYSAETVS
ncbi:MAG TPA: ABC transporter permease [Bryobacteraceae bacterium]|nr:ABC transporter permease [Bryobacteraceae bacterium]